MQKTGAYITAVAIVPVTTADFLMAGQVKYWVHNAMFCVLVCAANAIYFPISIGLKNDDAGGLPAVVIICVAELVAHPGSLSALAIALLLTVFLFVSGVQTPIFYCCCEYSIKFSLQHSKTQLLLIGIVY